MMLGKDHAADEAGKKNTLSMTYTALGSILLGLGASLGFGLGGLYVMGDQWMQLNEALDQYYTMTPVSQPFAHLRPITLTFANECDVAILECPRRSIHGDD